MNLKKKFAKSQCLISHVPGPTPYPTKTYPEKMRGRQEIGKEIKTALKLLPDNLSSICLKTLKKEYINRSEQRLQERNFKKAQLKRSRHDLEQSAKTSNCKEKTKEG